jgi:hypothetical protein
MPVHTDEQDVVLLLSKMKLPRWVLLELASKIAGERANITEDDVPTAAGYETWRWGTRYAREDTALKELGWVACEKDQVSGLRNDAVGIKLVICNTDANTGNKHRPPKNLSEKGPASCKLIKKNRGQYEMSFIKEEKGDELWYFCQHFSEHHITLELSKPDSEMGGIISSFSERIIIAKPGEIPGIRRIKVPQEFAEVPKPKVSRKPS